jgi:hypothetical protein
MLRRVIFGHVERVVGAEHNLVGTILLGQELKLVVCKHRSIEIHIFEIAGGRLINVQATILALTPSVVHASGIGGHEGAAMHNYKL